MNWTQKQQQVIDARDRSLLVSAAAGSGKTAVLVERIHGDFYNVMGLPLAHTVRMLERVGVFPTKRDK